MDILNYFRIYILTRVLYKFQKSRNFLKIIAWKGNFATFLKKYFLLVIMVKSENEMKRKSNNNWIFVALFFLFIIVSIWGIPYIAEEIKRQKTEQYISLHIAAENNSTKVAKILIENDADVNEKNANGDTPLHIAAENNSTRVAKILIENGADVNATNFVDQTPLHYAAQLNSTKVAKILIENGADVNAEDADMYIKPLYAAAANNSTKVAEILIENGADVNDVDRLNWMGYTPLHHAVKLGNAELAGILIASGADLNAKDANGYTPFGSAEEPQEMADPPGSPSEPEPDPISESEKRAWETYVNATEAEAQAWEASKNIAWEVSKNNLRHLVVRYIGQRAEYFRQFSERNSVEEFKTVAATYDKATALFALSRETEAWETFINAIEMDAQAWEAVIYGYNPKALLIRELANYLQEKSYFFSSNAETYDPEVTDRSGYPRFFMRSGFERASRLFRTAASEFDLAAAEAELDMAP